MQAVWCRVLPQAISSATHGLIPQLLAPGSLQGIGCSN